MMDFDINPDLVYDAQNGDTVTLKGKLFTFEETTNDLYQRVYLTAQDPLDFLTEKEWEDAQESYPYVHMRVKDTVAGETARAAMGRVEMIRRIKEGTYWFY